MGLGLVPSSKWVVGFCFFRPEMGLGSVPSSSAFLVFLTRNGSRFGSQLEVGFCFFSSRNGSRFGSQLEVDFCCAILRIAWLPAVKTKQGDRGIYVDSPTSPGLRRCSFEGKWHLV
jgi:hypothetical protein